MLLYSISLEKEIVMHTFELICRIKGSQYRYLHDHLPNLAQVSKYVERTNSYSVKGITQIELKTYEYPDGNIMRHEYYLAFRCNPSVIMGDSKTFLIDLEKYYPTDILEQLQERLYEIKEFRHIKLNEIPISMFLARTVHIAVDVQYEIPQLIVWLCNMSFPYSYHRMKRFKINKPEKILYTESCYFGNKSRKVNIYNKLIAMQNTGKEIDPKEFEKISHIVRLEIQLEKQGICNMKLPTKRSLEPFLNEDFCHGYIEKEMKSIFGIEKFVSKSKAVELINNSTFKPYDKAVMLSIINMIYQFKGLYELEKAIADENVYTPPQYGNLRTFKNRWLKKFKKLCIQPVVIPDILEIEEIPSIYELVNNISY